MRNHHMDSQCSCGRVKDNRAIRCAECFLYSGDARRGTGRYQPRYSNGYKFIYLPNHPQADKSGYYEEHRYILEQKLGRLLSPEEITHHKDEVRSNNDPDNLEATTNGEHIKHHSTGRFLGWSWRQIEGKRRWIQ